MEDERPRGRLLFRVGALDERSYLVELGRRCSIREGVGDADLVVYCDAPQLEELVRHGFSARPLRTVGDVSLLDTLAELLEPPQSPLALRSRGSER